MPERFRLTEDNRKWWTLGAMCFALFMIMLDNTVVNVALPSIQRSLHTTLSNLEWTVNAYTLTFGVLLVTGGRAGDIFGRRRMFLFGVMLFAASSAAIGPAPTDSLLIAGRAVPGIATLSVGLTALILALVESNSWGWGSDKIIGLLAVAVFSLVAFVAVEAKFSPAPMVQFEFFKSRTFFGANLVAFIVSFAMLAMFFLTALYIQNILGYSPLQAGVRFLPTTLMIVLIAPIAGRLSDRIGPRPLMVTGLALTTVSLFLQTRITVSSGYIDLLPAFVLMGGGMALGMSPMSTAAMNAVPATKAGVASGILSMNRMVGG